MADKLDMRPDEFSPSAAIGIAIGDELVAGVVYHEYRKLAHGGSIQASIAATTPRWCSRAVLRDIFAYPFDQLRCSRLWVSVARTNKPSRSLVQRMGFKLEGVGRKAWDGRVDTVVYSMLPYENPWRRKDG